MQNLGKNNRLMGKRKSKPEREWPLKATGVASSRGLWSNMRATVTECVGRRRPERV